jgi:effector-binding domain-containing protein/uncharacterized protein YndB with AHSA1/START domain
MKALKIIGIIFGVLVAAILIVPLFVSSPAVVSATIEIALEPEQIFPSVASYENREAWDPWLTTDSTAVATIDPKPGYVGSTYKWEGEMLGNGRMEVFSVEENAYIQSNLWFGNAVEPAKVEWTFQQVDGGTQVVWSFTQDTKYPIERLGMIFGKMFLQKSFQTGLEQLKALMESNPPKVTCLGPISIGDQAAFEAMVTEGAGTMEEIGMALGELFGLVYGEAGKQNLQVNGPAFVLYLDYDEATGFSNYLAGVPVAKSGSVSGSVRPVTYPGMKVVSAVHTGPYEKFMESYETMGAYIQENGIEISGEAFEFYTVNGQDEPDPDRWQTVIAFPVK